MNKSEAIALVKSRLTEERCAHTMRVAETAQILAERYNEPQEAVQLAAILHDVAKNDPPGKLKHWILNSDLPKNDPPGKLKHWILNSDLPDDLLTFHHELWHGPVGALLMEQEQGITDRRVLNAIRYHTTGRAGMTTCDMIIFLADYIEPARDFPGVDNVRKAAQRDLCEATWLALRNTIRHLIDKQ